ncbi:MAG: PD-(D/E)XK nuclease family protein [Gammaproteobacteria bacterium]
MLLSALADCDLNRSFFRVETLEKRITIELNGFSLISRIDRVDRLENGGLVIIDYKTGSRARPADWLKFRLVDTQIPLYTLAAEEPVRAAVIGILRTGEVRYRGFWDQVDSFPGSPESLSRYQRSWADQQKVWREQLTTLLKEFSQGDVHFSVLELKGAEGVFAPLTRVYEQLALARSNAVIGAPHER